MIGKLKLLLAAVIFVLITSISVGSAYAAIIFSNEIPYYKNNINDIDLKNINNGLEKIYKENNENVACESYPLVLNYIGHCLTNNEESH